MHVKRWFLQDAATDEGSSGGAVATEATVPVTPVVESSSSADAQPAGSDVDWIEMSTPDVDGSTPQGKGTLAKVEAAPVPAAPLPATPVSAAATAPVQPVVVPTPAPVQQPVTPTEAVAPAQPTQPDHAALRVQELDRLQTFYALNDEDARMAITQPEAVLPKLAANLHLNVVDSVVNTIISRIPDIVRATQQREIASSRNEDEFYKAWPDLSKPEYKETVYRAVASYRQLNPQAPMDEVVRAAGLQATIHLRLPIPRHLLEPSVVTPVQTTHTPAMGNSSAGVMNRNNSPTNPFEVLSTEFLDEDRR